MYDLSILRPQRKQQLLKGDTIKLFSSDWLVTLGVVDNTQIT